MAKQRYINTKFWSDNFIVELNPLDRYLFLYFLTNEHTNICGVYELPLRTMAFETGIEKDMLQKMLERLKKKIFYIDGWVYIKNFAKHQRNNDSIQKGIARTLKEIPDEIMAKIKGIDTDWDSLRQTGTDCDLPKPKPKPKNIYPPNFLLFWKEYPRKVEKSEALKEWKAIKPNQDLFEKIIKGVKCWETNELWKKDNGKFIIYPARFLKRRRWEDEVAEELTEEQKLWK